MPQVAKFILIYGGGTLRTLLANEIRRGLQEHHVHVVQDSLYAPIKQMVATGLGERIGSMNTGAMVAELHGRSIEYALTRTHEFMQEEFGGDCLERWLYRRILRTIPVPLWVTVDDPVDWTRDALKPNVLIHIVNAGVEAIPNMDYYYSVPTGNVSTLWSFARKIANELAGVDNGTDAR